MNEDSQSTDEIERCRLCEPAPHPNCEVYATVEISDPKDGESGTFPVCIEHFDSIKQSLSAGTDQGDTDE